MRIRTTITALLAIASFAITSAAHAAPVTFTDTNLASGNPVTVGTTTLTTTTVGGNIDFIGAGIYTGLWLGGDESSGTYTLSFSEYIDSIEIEFDALSDIGVLPEETLFNFATSNGPVSITFTPQFGATFDGTTITSTENDGQGIINFSGAPFNSFTFDHNQGEQAGFVIERLVVNTNPVPEPATLTLVLAALGLVGVFRRLRS